MEKSKCDISLNLCVLKMIKYNDEECAEPTDIKNILDNYMKGKE